MNVNVNVEQLEALIVKYRAMITVEKEGDVIPQACGGTNVCVLVNVVYELEDVLRKKRGTAPPPCPFGRPCGPATMEPDTKPVDSNPVDSDPRVTRSADGTEE